MKLKKLKINSHRHLQNLNFDFTYPEGHANFGQPLKKICIIGQSATGKTTVLELIKQAIQQLSIVEILNDRYLFNYSLGFDGRLELEIGNSTTSMENDTIIKNGTAFRYTGAPSGGTISSLFSDELRMLYFSAEIISKTAINILNQNPLDIINQQTAEPIPSGRRRFTESIIYEFGPESQAEIWLNLLNKILDYRKKFTQMAAELINKGSIGNITLLNKEFEKWAKKNENPLISIATYLNPILDKMNLEVDLINTQYTIPIKAKNHDDIIPTESLSTGTKSLLLFMFPLYAVETSNSLILVDEPERSLFPDMQIDLIDYYQKLAPKAQLMVATHSPFIAAAFEPEERFILYFDKEGNVKLRKGSSPIGDDPNDILENDFNINYYNEFGKQAYQRYLDLKKKALEENEPVEKKKLIKELSNLGDKYNFE